MNHYTNVISLGDSILYRGIRNGKRVTERLKFSPFLFLESDKPSKYKTIHGKKVSEMQFDTMGEAREFCRKYENVDNFRIYGNQSYEYVFIGEKHKNEIEWDIENIRIANIDIEVESKNGYATVEGAENEIQTITIRLADKVYALGFKDYKAPKNVVYIKCTDEVDLLNQFLDLWCSDYPDIVTGWNIGLYDIPYLVNRITKILGANYAKKLSPWNQIHKRQVNLFNRMNDAYEILGIAQLDYMMLYRKFDPKGTSQEDYKLNTIAYVVLEEEKLDYSEYESLAKLYEMNFQKFMDYNIQDTALIDKMDEKLKLIELAITLAYTCKCNFDDVFTQTRMWDALIYNFLWNKNIVLPPKNHSEKVEFQGAWVKEPKLGKFRWVVSFDFTSLYPSLMMMFNISPEKIVDEKDWPIEIRNLMSQGISVEKILSKKINFDILKKYNFGITPNRQIFKNDSPGFMTEIIADMFAKRQMYKGKMKDAKKNLEKAKTEEEKKFYEKQISKFNNLQAIFKITLNSCYGATGSNYFRFYDTRIAEAVTTSGQTAIIWVINAINEYLNKLFKTDRDWVIAADTDSCFILMDELVYSVFEKKDTYTKEETIKIIDFMDKVCNTKLQPHIQKKCKELAEYMNSYENKLDMKREKLIDVGILTSKKHYIWNVWDDEGVRYQDAKASIVGLEMVKSIIPSICKKTMKDLFVPILLNGTESECIAAIKKFRKQFESIPVEQIALPKGMNGLKEYGDKDTIYKKATPLHVRGSLLYNYYLSKKNLKNYEKIKEGNKIKYTYLKLPNPIKENAISFLDTIPTELNLTQYIDYVTMFDKTFLSPLKIITEAIGWNVDRKKGLF